MPGRKSTKVGMADAQKQSKELANRMAAELEAGGAGGTNAAEMLDESKRMERVINNMRSGKAEMSKSMEKLDSLMYLSAKRESRSSGGRLSSKGSSGGAFNFDDGAEAGARRIREFQQNAASSQSNELHARLCANNILRDAEMAAEVDLNDKSNISVRQLLTVDDRCAGVRVDDSRFEKKDEKDIPPEFSSGLKKRDIVSWRTLLSEQSKMPMGF